MNREFFKRKTVEPFLRELKNAWIWTNFKFDYFIVLNGMSVGIMVMPHKEYYDEESLDSLKRAGGIPLIVDERNWKRISKVLTILSDK